MSHFTVGVILDHKAIDDELKDISKHFGIDVEDKSLQRESKELLFEIIQRHTEAALDPYYEGKEVEPYLHDTMEDIQAAYDRIQNLTKEEIETNSYNEYLYKLYKGVSLEEFISTYYNGELGEDGIYVTWNPNPKWDWYVIGGRWAKTIPLKNSNKNKNIDRDTIDTYSDDIGSFAKIKNISFTKELTQEQEEKLRASYEYLTTEGDIYKPEYYQKRFPTFEDFIANETIFNTYALLTSDGTWHEPGAMSWFGMSSAEPEEEKDFSNKYLELISKENSENYFVIVDCHI